MSTAYVLVEYDGDQVLPITGELITAAKVFESVTAVVVGPAGAHEPLVPQLAALGADAIVAAVGADTAQRVVLPAADALSMLAAGAPGPILVGCGRDQQRNRRPVGRPPRLRGAVRRGAGQ